MEIEFLSKFSDDLNSINQKVIKKKLLKLISLIENSSNISQIPNVKKLSGHQSAFRIRIGDYRIGIFINKDKVQFARIIHRKDIYKFFP